MVKALGDKVDTTFVENVPEGADAERAIEQLARTGHKLIFTTSFGFMDATIKVAAKYPNVFFEHCTGFKRAEECEHLCGPLLRRPLHPGPDCGEDVEVRGDRLYRLLPDSRGDLRHQLHHPRGAEHQSEHQGQDRLGQFLVRPGQGGRRRQGARRSGRRHPDPAHRLARPPCRSRSSAASMRSGNRPT